MIAMAVSEVMIRVDELAQKLFDVITQFCLTIPRHRRRSGDLKEVEFLTLSILCHHDTLIVGDIQRMLGVLPAQMSRIIRSLETREQAFIACRINPQDKRKIDVALTEAGRLACQEYQTTRIASIAQFLSKMSEDDLENLHSLLAKMHDQLERNGA
jgi:DNA-binding MarR family transcriptional regulator